MNTMIQLREIVLLTLLLLFSGGLSFGQLVVNFDEQLREWDGFGINYVETCNIRDFDEYLEHPQDYGGLSTLSEAKRQEILDLIFGPEGLKPGLVKMFLDPFHEREKGRFDHETTTRWMRYFVREGLERTGAQGGDLQIITTMYGPPAWATKQRMVRGRDLDPAEKEHVARYMISWARFLRDHEQFPVKYISLHNEGDQYDTWDNHGIPTRTSDDYNLFWPVSQVVDFLGFMRPLMDQLGLNDVGLTNGEYCIWEDRGPGRTYMWIDVAQAISNDPAALNNLGLITSHGFTMGGEKWVSSSGTDLLRKSRPDLHAWTTSKRVDPPQGETKKGPYDSFSSMSANIYIAKVNGLIPWAIIQSDPWTGVFPEGKPTWGGLGPQNWVGTGIWVDRKGGYQVLPGYYRLMQVYRAGQPGMAVAKVNSQEANICLMAFANNGTDNPDALVANNAGDENSEVSIQVSGTDALYFEAFITDPAAGKFYAPLGRIRLSEGKLDYTLPPKSIITFFADLSP